MKKATLTSVITDRQCLRDKGITFIESGQNSQFLSYEELYRSALHVLSYLQQSGLQPKDELVFQIEDNKTFVIAFWACILGGIIPVPVSVGHNDEHKQKLFNIWGVLNNPYLIVAEPVFRSFRDFAGKAKLNAVYEQLAVRIIDEEEALMHEGQPQVFEPTQNDIAFVQFSSGSTGDPKGVVLTHGNLIANMEGISHASNYQSTDSMISWMPLTHDMGLIGFHLNPLYSGMNQFLIPTNLFIRRPALWISKVSEHKVNILSSPNFGYKYLLKHCEDNQYPEWDLSHVRLIYNGAEPISYQLCNNFIAAFSKYGLRNTAIRPVYGLAEASLAVSISNLHEEIKWINLEREQCNFLDTVTISENGSNALSFVCVGKNIQHCLLRITDEFNEELEENVIGHISISGANVTAGYYNNIRETNKVINEDGWLRTGDLGFVRDGELYVTGRSKDIIFFNGMNYYPHDIERVAEVVEGIELNKIAVAGYFNEAAAKDEVVAFVFHRGSLESFVNTIQALQAVIGNRLSLELDKIIPVKDIPRTTSGKLQRFKLLEKYRAGEFAAIEQALANLLSAGKPRVHAVTAPETTLEKHLVSIWQRVLQFDEVGVTDHFFELGGNSLRAAEMLMRVMKDFHIELPLKVIHEAPTIRGLAHHIKNATSQYHQIEIAAPTAWYPVSSMQRGMYYAWEVDPYAISNNLPVALQVKGNVQHSRLEDCFRQLIARYDALRMSFFMVNEPVCKISDTVSFTLQQSACAVDELPAVLRRMVQPFDLNNGALVRAALIETAAAEQVLFIDFHHIISDGMSVYTFLEELWKLYAGEMLLPLTIGYKDYVCREKTRLETGVMARQEAFWKEHLKGELPLLEIPADFNRPVIFNTEGNKLFFTVNTDVVKRLKGLCRENNCSMHALLFTIYNVLLKKITGQNAFVVGIPVAGRRHPELQGLFGLFVNNLPVKTVIDDNASFNSLLQLQKEVINSALDNQEFPFDEIYQKLDYKRDISRNPVFDTMFIYQNMGMPAIADSSLSVARLPFDPGFSKFDMSMEVFENGNHITYGIEYATCLFTENTITNIAGYFDHLLNSIAAQPETAISNINIVTAATHCRLVNDFNATQVDYLYDVAVHQLFEQQVLLHPDAVAVEFEGVEISYRELNDKANGLANLLLEYTGGVAKPVGILLDRTPDFVVAVLAVFKAGCFYIPIDITLPEARIRYMLTDSNAGIVVTDSKRYAVAVDVQIGSDNMDLSIINIDIPFSKTHQPVINNAAAPGQLAYIIYTSGTTGLPKGVMIEHRSLTNYISWSADKYVKGEKATFALYTSVSFDLTVTSLFTPLVTGNKVVLYPNNDQHLLIEKVLSDNKAEIIKLTPSHLKIIRDSKAFTYTTGSCIKRFIVGGEQLEAALANDIYTRFNGEVEIFNEYGPTEATVGCMIHQFNPNEPYVNVPVGVPAHNTQIYLLDSFLQPVPEGVYGEMYIAGDGLAKGYLFKEELTAQKFVENPFVPGTLMYKTGDMAKWLPGAIIEYIGRFDQQVKVNGYRIELSEIENCLTTHELVNEGLVVLKKNSRKQKVLCAYFRSETLVTVTELRNFLSARLPHYMVPVHYVRVDKWPLTTNGKVDVEALPVALAGDVPANNVPVGEMEEICLNVWRTVLQDDAITLSDNFFEIGGDSIKSVQISARLQEAGVSLKAKDILTYSSIEQISRYARFTGSKAVYEQGFQKGNKRMSAIDRWFFSHSFAQPGFYNQSVLLQLNKPVDIALLEKAFQVLVQHHDALRLNYNETTQTLFFNEAHTHSRFVINAYELLVEAGDEKNEITALLGRLKAGFSLSDSLLIKAAIIFGSNQAQYLFITAHHLVVDGVSWRILLEDLYTAYNALSEGQLVKLPLKTASLTEVDKRLQKQIEAGRFNNEAAWWQQVENLPVQVLVPDSNTNDWRVANMAKKAAWFTSEQTGFLLKKAHHAYKTDVQTLLVAALALTIRQWAGANRFVVEMESHGRQLDDADTSRTVGWFTSMYPVALNANEAGIGNHIKSIKEQLKQVPAQGIGYGVARFLQKNLSGKPVERSPLRFNYLGQFDNELDNDLFSYSYLNHGAESASDNVLTACLEWNLMMIKGNLVIEIQYNQLAYKAESIEKLLQAFLHHLTSILQHIEQKQEVDFTPSDFEMANLQADDLDILFSA